jgi:tetratricopeptide (TPR) repeat protein
LGFPDKGLRQSLDFLSWARERAQPLPLIFALDAVVGLFGWRGEGHEALKYADATLALTAEHGLSNWHAFAQIGHGHALAMLGNTDEAIPEIKGALAAFEAMGGAVPGWAYSALAFAYLAAQQPAQGLNVVSKALQVADQTGDGEAKTDLHRLKGELLLIGDPSNAAEAEASFRAAIDVARERSVKLPELGATISLARLLRDTGRRDEARTMLAETYGWFSEGFETACLIEAKALLDELN